MTEEIKDEDTTKMEVRTSGGLDDMSTEEIASMIFQTEKGLVILKAAFNERLLGLYEHQTVKPKPSSIITV